MCGIGALLQPSAVSGSGFAMGDEHLTLLARRGPDVQRTMHLPLQLDNAGVDAKVVLHGSVLSMRGTSPLPQPLVCGSLHLMWNGEVYSGIDIADDGNDGFAVLLSLAEEYARVRNLFPDDEFLPEFSQRTCVIMSCLIGPFAFVLYDKETQCLWFGRDVVGRRSLLTRTVVLEGCAAFCAASVAPPQPADAGSEARAFDGNFDADTLNCSDESDSAQCLHAAALSEFDSGWLEVSPTGIWQLRVEQLLKCSSIPQAHLCPWIIPLKPMLPFANDNSDMCCDAVLCCLENSVKARALVHSGTCGIGILFSGGLDCMIIAALAARCVADHTVIDLFNVAFDAAEAPDRESACAGFIELCTLFPSICWRLFAYDVDESESSRHRHHIFSLIHPCRTNMDLSISTALWFASRGVGVVYERHHISDATAEARSCNQKHVNASSSSSAAEAKKEMRLKVSLEKKERQMQEAQSRREMKQQRRDAAALEPKQLHSMELSSNVESVISVVSLKDLSIAESSFKSESHASHAEVAEAAPREAKQNEGRGIRSEQEDESLKKSIHHSTVAKNRQKQLQQWAAARPTVPITSSYFTPPLGTVLQPQLSPTRVLLSGLGADELCGGYARYRTAHRHGGDSAARASMKADVDRIWLRNLGRDDRIISDNGREMRTPYLDTSFISLLQLVPTSLLLDASAPSGVGDKMILRRAAAKLGLTAAAQRPKRAIQFGCRIAKQLNRSFFGASCSGSGTAIVAGLGGDPK